MNNTKLTELLSIALNNDHSHIVEFVLQEHDHNNNLIADITFGNDPIKSNKLLVWAINNDRIDIIKLLLDNHCLVNQSTILNSIKSGNLEIVKLLLGKHKLPKHEYDNFAKIAVANNFIEIAELLTNYTDTVLEHAKKENKNGIIEYISNENEFINSKSNKMIQAIENIFGDYTKHIDTIKKILSEKVDPTEYNNAAIKLACEKNYIDIVRIFIRTKNICLDFDNNYLLLFACKHGHIDIVRFLLRKNKKISRNVNIVEQAVRNGHYKIVELLLNNKFPITNDIFNIAVQNGYYKIVKILLNIRKDDYTLFVDITNNNAIKYAINRNYYRIVKLLLKQKIGARYYYEIFNITRYLIDISNKVNYKMMKILHKYINKKNINSILKIYSNHKNIKTLKLLLQDANITTNDIFNNNILLYITRFCSLDTIKLLFEHTNTDLSHKNNELFISACNANNHSLVIYLLEEKNEDDTFIIDPTDQDNLALHNACKHTTINLSILRILLNCPRIDVTDHKYIKSAVSGGCYDKVKILLDHGIDPTDELIELAAKLSNSKILRLLLSYPTLNPSANNNRSLHLAIQYYHYHNVELLLNDPRLRIDFEDPRFIESAINNESIKTIKLLLESRSKFPNIIFPDDISEQIIGFIEDDSNDILEYLLNVKDDNGDNYVNISEGFNNIIEMSFDDINIFNLILKHPYTIKNINLVLELALNNAGTTSTIMDILLENENTNILYNNFSILRTAINSKTCIDIIKKHTLFALFNKYNKIICMNRIKKFILKKIVLHPRSVYIRRLIGSWN
jgi:ankyrin repeat protein